jgi:hypothetical protein
MPHLQLGIIFVGAFVLAFAKTWSPKEAFEETFWFSAAYVGALIFFYAFDKSGHEILSTDPTGLAGAVALVIGFLAIWVRNGRWKKEKARKQALKAAERARRVAAGAAPERSLVTEAFRFAGSVNRARKSQRPRAE